MKRSLEQNDCLHKWCRVIAKHLQANNVRVSEETVKELILRKLGNCLLIDGVPGMEPDIIAMRSSKYKATDAELSPIERKRGFISMTNLLNQVEAWAATDLNLILKKDPEDQTVEEWLADYDKKKEPENESSTSSVATS
tara:strand:+ start:139 stop:555 length:417 start_codon:yes stop_codon:yes gene_type:complete